MRATVSFAIASSLALLLLFGCIAIPQEVSKPLSDASKPLSVAKALVEKSNLPLPSKSDSQPALPARLQSADAANQTDENSSVSSQQDVSPSPASNNTSTIVSSPSNESAEELPTKISISNPSQPQVYFYYSTYCPYSIRILPYMQLQQTRFENFTEWHSFNVFTQQGYYFFDKMAVERSIPPSGRVVPIVIITWGPHSQMMTGIQEINSTMVSLIWNVTKDARLAAN
ncbi:MAG: hypothetical protein NTV88_05755 [Candidatus Micrarchaeota archaeon]|nr:hypothetical protein [Candidatus Micrarchaeota archaeon]